MFRFFLFSLLLYFGYKAISNLLKAPERKGEVRGSPKKKPIDLDKHDVEDADFEELDD